MNQNHKSVNVWETLIGLRLIQDWHLAAVLFFTYWGCVLLFVLLTSVICHMSSLCNLFFFFYRTMSWDCSLLKSRWMAPPSQHTGMYTSTLTHQSMCIWCGLWTVSCISQMWGHHRGLQRPPPPTHWPPQGVHNASGVFLCCSIFVPFFFPHMVLLHSCCQVCFNTLVKYSIG